MPVVAVPLRTIQVIARLLEISYLYPESPAPVSLELLRLRINPVLAHIIVPLIGVEITGAVGAVVSIYIAHVAVYHDNEPVVYNTEILFTIVLLLSTIPVLPVLIAV